MFDALDRDDWERIADALKYFRHNSKYQETYQKVRLIIEANS